MGNWEKGCLFFLQIAVATWFSPYHCGFSFLFPTSIHQRCLAAQSPHYHFKFMEETNRRKSWQYRTFIFLPKFKAEHICENKALLDTFSNMFLFSLKCFLLKSYSQISFTEDCCHSVCFAQDVVGESSSRCQSACYACSASALPCCLRSPDTLNYTKVPPGQNKWSSSFTLPLPQVCSVWTRLMTMPYQPMLRHCCSSTKQFRDSFDKTIHTENTVYPMTLCKSELVWHITAGTSEACCLN